MYLPDKSKVEESEEDLLLEREPNTWCTLYVHLSNGVAK